MLNVLAILLGIGVVFLLARYNRSNKLFWKLLIALACGFTCGAVASTIANSSDSKKHACVMQDNHMQGLVSSNIIALLPQYNEENNTQAFAKPAGYGYSELTITHNSPLLAVSTYTARTFINLVNPGIAMNLFDTS